MTLLFFVLTSCQNNDDTKSFDCVSGNCIEDDNGPYNSLANCESACDDGGGGANTSCDGEDTFTDPRDGQTYAIVKIGDQCWFAENLRYSGSIPEVVDDTEWSDDTTGAWSYYDNDPANDSIYGKLYNWYAVSTNTLCPDGWHIPSDAEWTELIDYLGGSSIAGGKMKSTTGWRAPNTDATNSSGFSGLPGGNRSSFSNFNNVNKFGYWWSSTEESADKAWRHPLDYNSGFVIKNTDFKTLGMSCRCLKD